MASPAASPASSTAQVQTTNDEANLSKRSARDLGYFEDDFLHLFSARARRTPLVNRGYFARVHVIRKALADLAAEIKRTEGANERLQVVSLGAGFVPPRCAHAPAMQVCLPSGASRVDDNISRYLPMALQS